MQTLLNNYILLIIVYLLILIICNIYLKIDIYVLFNNKYSKNILMNLYLHHIYLNKKDMVKYLKKINILYKLNEIDNYSQEFRHKDIKKQYINSIYRIFNSIKITLLVLILLLYYFTLSFENNRINLIIITIYIVILFILIFKKRDLFFNKDEKIFKIIDKYYNNYYLLNDINIIIRLKNIYNYILRKTYKIIECRYSIDIFQVGINVLTLVISLVTFFEIMNDNSTISNFFEFMNNKKELEFANNIYIIFIFIFLTFIIFLLEILVSIFFHKYRCYDEGLDNIINVCINFIKNLEEQEKLLYKLEEINIKMEKVKLNYKSKKELRKENRTKIYNLKIEKDEINIKLEMLRKEFE